LAWLWLQWRLQISVYREMAVASSAGWRREASGNQKAMAKKAQYGKWHAMKAETWPHGS
jgi:hypothetical protein